MNAKIAESSNQTVSMEPRGIDAARTAQLAETVYVPDVDVREDRDAIRLFADMPGVDQDGIDVCFENGVLKIEGRPRCEAPAGYELVGREYGVGRFRREFAVSEVVNVEGIKARVRHGVLEVTLPRHEQSKARKINVES